MNSVIKKIQSPRKRRRRKLLIVTAVILLLAGVLTIVMFNGGCGIDHRFLSPKEEAVLQSQTQPGLESPKLQSPREILVSGKTETITMSNPLDNLYFVSPEINGKKFAFLIDTGAGICMLDPYVAIDSKIPLIPNGTFEANGSDGGQTGGFLGIVPRIKLGNMECLDTPVLIRKMSSGFQILGVRVGRLDGLLGNCFFGSFICTFDAKEKILTFRLPKDFDLARDLPELIDSIPFKFDEHGHIALNIRVAGHECNAILDFAADRLLLPQALVQELKIPFKKNKIENHGIGGKSEELSFTGGPVTVEFGKEKVDVDFACPPGIKDYSVIGNHFFHLYRLTIDFPNKIIYVEKRQK